MYKNYLIEVQGGFPEPEKPQIQLSMPIHQSIKQNINSESPDLPSLQLQGNTGVESGLNRTENKISQTLIPGKGHNLEMTPKSLNPGH